MEEDFNLVTDHFAAFITLSKNIITKAENPKLPNKTTDWERFKIYLENRFNLNVNLD